ncbi:hypothetical protein [uncultured Microbacterium sp.]|uniref:hypothetical protein n=1 Tax=uncultured Microbacterium sp. TaxID=191216 RepID=UPI0028D57E27|nr:hypothetical protein [uncultured Microbacterium sp.]
MHGRIKGEAAFRRYVARASDELRQANYTVSAVDLIVTPTRTVEEVILSTDGPKGRVDLPIAIVTDRGPGGLVEIRMYFSTWPITGEHAIRPPLLQHDPNVHEKGAVGDYQRALAAGDLAATLAAFEPQATVREPAGGEYTHTGTAELTELYTLFFSNGGGIPLEHCTVPDDGRACALEYNVTQWGRAAMPPEAGVAVYVRGASGKLIAARIYDDSNPPLHRPDPSFAGCVL